jgi:hypothetical protein
MCHHSLVSTHRKTSKGHLNVWINEVAQLAGKRFLYVCHQRRVHFWQTVGAIDLHNETGALTIYRYTIRKQQIGFDVVFIFFALWWNFDGIPLSDDADVTLQISFRTSCYIVRIGEQSPLVIKLVIDKVIILSNNIIGGMWKSKTKYSL